MDSQTVELWGNVIVMKDTYTYEQISAATKLFLQNVEQGYNCKQLSDVTGICENRIRTWRRRYKFILKTFPLNACCLCYISNLTYGVSEEVWNLWLDRIDENMNRIKQCGAFSNRIRTILEDIAKEIDDAVAPNKGTTDEMIDRALAHLMEETSSFND